MLRMEELDKMTLEELHEQGEKIARELFTLNNELRVSRKLDRPHMLNVLKKDRARILTAISQKTYNLNQR